MIRYFVFGLSLSFSLALVSTLGLSPAHSQTAPLEDDSPYGSKERDAFSSGGQGIDPFDMLHRINTSPGQSLEEFRQKQERNLDSAAAEFRQQQEQLLQQQSPSAGKDSGISPE